MVCSEVKWCKGMEEEVDCQYFDWFSYSCTEINYSAEACMVAGLMVHAADKSTIGLKPLREISGRGETLQDKHRSAFDVGTLYPSLTISNLEISRENGDGEHMQSQITIQIWGYNVKKCAHYIILNADFAPKDKSVSLSLNCGRIWKRRAGVAVERLKCCYILQPLETCRHSNWLPPPPPPPPPSPSVSFSSFLLCSQWLCSGSFFHPCSAITFPITLLLCINIAHLFVFMSFLLWRVCTVHISVHSSLWLVELLHWIQHSDSHPSPSLYVLA